MDILVKYLEQYEFDLVKYDQIYKKHFIAESYEVFKNYQEFYSWKKENPVRILWVEEHPLF